MIDQIWAGVIKDLRTRGWVESESDEALARTVFYTATFMMFEAYPLLNNESHAALRVDAKNWILVGKGAPKGHA
jgi:hypothetical protein